MLGWFKKYAPIRVKFTVLTATFAAYCGIGLLTTILAGGSPLLVGIAAGGVIVSIATMLLASHLICQPYVETVVRMEALAAGDTDSPFDYTEHRDCVGRMTRAMAVFRDNAVQLKAGRDSQEANIVAPLSQGLRALASGKLDIAIKEPFPAGYDELRCDFNAALASLAKTIEAVRQGASGVQLGATEIRSASDDLANRNERQAASLEETAASMNDITANIRQTAERALDVQHTVADAHREATEGGTVVVKAIEAMAAIEKSASEIGQIINVIDGIAFQTNLLALNAGVEAARAGDAGKGFAVVANEVRALAQRSADAAKNIKELITVSTRQVNDGVSLVGATGDVLEKIVGSIGEINALMGTIAENATIQSANLQQINTAVGEMDRMTQQNAAMVEQSTAAARSLSDEAHQLTTIVSAFQTGSTPDAAPAPAPRARATRKSAPPPVLGNLALKAPASDDADWTEF